MTPLKTNTKWMNGQKDTSCRWCNDELGHNNHENVENEQHIMENCEPIIRKHGEDIRKKIPNLDEKTPFTKNTREQWSIIGKFLENINRDLMNKDTQEDPPRNVSTERLDLEVDDGENGASHEAGVAELSNGGTVQPFIRKFT